MQDVLALGASCLLLTVVAFVYGWAPFLQGPQPLLLIMLSGLQVSYQQTLCLKCYLLR